MHNGIINFENKYEHNYFLIFRVRSKFNDCSRKSCHPKQRRIVNANVTRKSNVEFHRSRKSIYYVQQLHCLVLSNLYLYLHRSRRASSNCIQNFKRK